MPPANCPAVSRNPAAYEIWKSSAPALAMAPAPVATSNTLAIAWRVLMSSYLTKIIDAVIPPR